MKKNWKLIFDEACQAGLKAAEDCTPTPMIVSEDRPNGKQYYVPQGVCGFAWVTIKPGTSSAARWAKKHLQAQKAYRGGISIWVSYFGQCMEKKEAYAQAYAQALRQHGVKAYAGSRMD